MALTGSILYAIENILQEHVLKKDHDILHTMAWLGFFSSIITITEGALKGEFGDFINVM